jgi:hypothetical protein
MEHTEIKDASVLVGQAILVLRRKAKAMPKGAPFLKGVSGTMKFSADKLAEMLPMIEHVERMAATKRAERVEGKHVRD